MSGQIFEAGSVLQQLAGRLDAPVSASARRRAMLHVLDWLGCACAGLREPDARGFLAEASGNHANGGSCRLLGGDRTPWWQALLGNAAFGNLLEMDDVHRIALLHPGPVIVPAAIAAAEHLGASPRALLEAIVRGYEATIRIGQALGSVHYRYYHSTSSCGAFGAAVAASSLLGLDRERSAWALANAGSRTGGLWQLRHEACQTKPLHNVQAAQSGVLAALLAARGVRGPLSLLEGEQGLFAATAPGADAGDVLRSIDADWAIFEVSFKPWPACRHAHAAIDAALVLREQVPDAAAIATVELDSYRTALAFCDCATPQNPAQARFSLQHVAAVTLLRGPPKLEDFAPSTLAAPALAALRARVQLGEDAALTQAFPQHYGATLRLRLHDGRVLSHTVHDAWGDPAHALVEDDVAAKAHTLLAAAGLAPATAQALIDATRALADGDNHDRDRLGAWTGIWP